MRYSILLKLTNMKSLSAIAGNYRYFALMVFLLLHQCKGGRGSSIRSGEKDEEVSFYRNYTGVYFDPGNFLKFNGIAQALDESGLHSLLHKIHSRFDQIMVPFHFPLPFDEHFSNDFVPEAVARYNSACNESSHFPRMKIIIWCKVHDWSNVKMIHSRIQKLKRMITNANHNYPGTVNSVLLEIEDATNRSFVNYVMFRNSLHFCGGTLLDKTVKFGIQMDFTSSIPGFLELNAMQFLRDKFLDTAYISEYENGAVSRDSTDTVKTFTNHFNLYTKLAVGLNKTITMGFLTSWPDTDGDGSVKYSGMVDFWRRFNTWAGSNKIPIVYRQAFDTPYSDEIRYKSDGWWKLVPNTSYAHPSQFVIVEKQSLLDSTVGNLAFLSNLTMLRSETHFSRYHVGVAFRPYVFRPVAGKPVLHRESSIISLIQRVYTKFSKILISTTAMSESDRYWIWTLPGIVAEFNGNKSMEVIMTFDELSVHKVIEWASKANDISSLTVKNLCYSVNDFSVNRVADSLQDIEKVSTNLSSFSLGIEVNVEICNDWVKFGIVMKVVHSYFDMFGANAIYINAENLTSGLSKLGVERAFPLLTILLENCIAEVDKYFRNKIEDIQVVFRVGWTIYDEGNVDHVLQFVLFWEEMNEWAIRINTTIIFASAFDIPTMAEGSSTTNVFGWWGLLANDTFPETVDDYIFEDKKQVALRLAESKPFDKSDQVSNLSSVQILVISVTIPIIAVLSISMLTVCYFLQARNSNNLTKQEIAEFFKGRGTGNALENEENIEKISKISHVELSKKCFTIDEESPPLGSGKFGKVCRGTVVNASTGEQENVAVKMANKVPCPKATLRSLMFETKMLSFLGKHPHIVELIGAYTTELKKRRIFIFLELCSLGSLQSYLKSCKTSMARRCSHGDEFDDSCSEAGPSCGATETELEQSLINDMSRWAGEIATGMAYIASKFIVHLDIATRNVLLTAEKRAKLTDFGLSRQLYDYHTYVKKEMEDPLPWRWMAPESLQTWEFTEKTDVWGFGVLLWEIYSLGDQPYPCESGFQFASKLKAGIRLDRPTYDRNNMYTVMLRCWEFAPERRPTFSELVESLCPNVSFTGPMTANDYKQPATNPPTEQVNDPYCSTIHQAIREQPRSKIPPVGLLLWSVGVILLVMISTISVMTYYNHKSVEDDAMATFRTRNESATSNLADLSRPNQNSTDMSISGRQSDALGLLNGSSDIGASVTSPSFPNGTELNADIPENFNNSLDKCLDEEDSESWGNRDIEYRFPGLRLMDAIYRQDEDTIKLLVMLGADVNVVNRGSPSPLIQAAIEAISADDMNRSLRIVKLLIDKGADVHAEYGASTFLHELMSANLTSNEFHDIGMYLIQKNMSHLFNARGRPFMTTPLQLAVKNFDVEIPTLSMLHDNGVNVDPIDEHGNSILYYLLVWERGVALLSYLIELGVDINHLNKYHQNALHAAARFGHISAIKYLADRKLDINAQDKKGNTPLHVASTLRVKSWNTLETVEVLIQNGAEWNIKNHEGLTPVDLILANRNVRERDKIIQLFRNEGALDEMLSDAIEKEDEDGIKELVLHGAHVNLKDHLLQTPLIKIAFCKTKRRTGDLSVCLRIIKYLVGSGADALAQDIENATFLHALLSSSPTLTPSQFHDITAYLITKNMTGVFNIPGTKISSFPLQVALTKIDVYPATLSLLHKNGVKFDVLSGEGYSILMVGLFGNRNITLLSLLVSFGADVNQLNAFNQSALHLAAEFGHVDGIKFLLQHNLNINIQDATFGNTPLHQALGARENKNILETVKVLIHYGAKVSIKNFRGNTPLDFAKWNPRLLHKEEVIELLLNATSTGAKFNPIQVDNDEGGILHTNNGAVSSNLTAEEKDRALGIELMEAIDRQDEEAIRRLLMLGADVNVGDPLSRSPLIRAVLAMRTTDINHRHLRIIKYLIENGADVDVEFEKCTFLHVLMTANLSSTEFHDIATFLVLRNMSRLFNTPGGPFMSSPLQLAFHGCEVGTNSLLMLYERGVNFEVVDIHGNSILTYVLDGNGSVPLLSYPVELGANINHVNNYNQTVLHYAAHIGHLEGIKYLVQRKADVNARDMLGNTPLHEIVATLDFKSWSILEIVRFLIQNGAHGNIKNNFGHTQLDWILQMTDVPDRVEIVKLLLSAKEYGNLITEVEMRNEEAVTFLIKRGADVNYKNDYLQTPLIRAAICRGANDKRICLKIIKQLVENGADVYAKDANNNTFLHALVSDRTTLTASQFHEISKYLTSKNMSALFNIPGWSTGSCPLQVAIRNIDVTVDTLTLLHEGGVNFDIVNDKGYSILSFALFGNRNITLISHLVTLGADVNRLTVHNQSALHHAAEYGHVDCIKYLLQHDLNVNVDAQDVHGNTPLHQAAIVPRNVRILERVSALIQYGANVTITNIHGETPLDYAKYNQYLLDQDQVVQLLTTSEMG